MDSSRTEPAPKARFSINWWRLPIALCWCLIVVIAVASVVLLAALLVKAVMFLMAGALPHAIYVASVVIPTVIIKHFLL